MKLLLALDLAELRVWDVDRVGGKAAHLGALLGAGFPVPNGICITTDAFRAGVQPYEGEIQSVLSGLRNQKAESPHTFAAAAAQIEEALRSLSVPEAVREALERMLSETGLSDVPVSVRSSAVEEDGAEVSLAGQFETKLGVCGAPAIVGAIETCWRSYFSANALAARAGAGRLEDDLAIGGMAVVIQRMVDAEGAGVAFGVDPLQPDSGSMLINATWGLGIGVVDGRAPADTLWVDRQRFAVTKRQTVRKGVQICTDAAGELVETPVPSEKQDAAVLPDEWAKRIAQYTFATERLFGGPQDVEWAVADQRLWILQSRPITGIHPQGEDGPGEFPVEWERADEARAFWQLDGAGDELPLPLEHDVRDAGSAARADAALITGRRSGAARPTVTRTKVINGRRYTRQVPIDLREGDELARSRTAAHLGERLRAQGVTPWEYAAPEVIAATRRLADFDADEADAAALATHLEDAFGVYRHHWTLHWVYGQGRDAFASPFNQAFETISGLRGAEARDAVMPLLEGLDNEFTKFLDDVYALACVATQAAVVARLIEEFAANESSMGGDIVKRLRNLGSEAAPFLRDFDVFLQKWGERSGAGYGSRTSITQPTLKEEPGFVIALLVPYIAGRAEAPATVRARAHQERERRIETLLQGCEDAEAVAVFRRLLPLMRRVRADLENHNHYIDQLALGQLRTAVMAAAHRLVEEGALSEPEELFWLHRDEIVAALRSQPGDELDATATKALVARRRDQYEAWKALHPPPFLGVPEIRLPARVEPEGEVGSGEPPTNKTPERDSGSVLQGEPASAGRRSGRARLVSMSERLPNVGPGDVLVAQNAGPLWTPLFPILAAVVLDQGVLFQHAATTAREYGLPAVIQTRVGTTRIREGDWVTVDGSAGTVEIHSSAGIKEDAG